MATNGRHQQIAGNQGRLNRVTPGVTNYVSPSRLNLWLRCPQAFKNRYVDGIVTPTTPSQFLGQRVHKSLEFYYRYRQDGVRLYPEYVGQHIKKTWEHAVAEECVTFESVDDERKLQSQAVDLVTAYLAQVPEDDTTPILVEHRFEAPLIDSTTGEDFGVSLVGIVDLIADDGRGPIIVDFKTGARSSSQLDVLHEIQLSCYSYLFRETVGLLEAGLEIRSLIKTKNPKVETHRFGPRQDVHFQRLFGVIRAYLAAVRGNRYHISPGFGCSFCDFRETCAGTQHTVLE